MNDSEQTERVYWWTSCIAISVIAVCIAAYEIAKLFAPHGVPTP